MSCALFNHLLSIQFQVALKLTAFQKQYCTFMSSCVMCAKIAVGVKKPWSNKQGSTKFKMMKERGLPKSSSLLVHVIGNGSPESSQSVLLVTDHKRYLFNCGCGTQRALMESGAYGARLEHVFITQSSLKNCGDLLSMSLSLKDFGCESLTIHGPPGVESVFGPASNREVVQDEGMSARKRELSSGPFVDHAITISSTVLSLRKHEENVCLENDVVAYVCQLHNSPGALNMQKCMTVGVPRGSPLLGKLKSGESVTLPNGDIVHSADVVYPPVIYKPVVILQCPSTDYIPAILQNALLKKFQSGNLSEDIETKANENEVQDEGSPEPGNSRTSRISNASKDPCLVVHLTPPEVLSNADYKTWISKFHSGTEHLILNLDSPSYYPRKVCHKQSLLNKLNQDIFPLLSRRTEPNFCLKNKNGSLISPQPFLQYDVRRQCYKDPVQESLDALESDLDYFNEALEKMREKVHPLDVPPWCSQQHLYPQIVFLGTASSVINLYRATSAILVHLSDHQCFMLDCGADALHQLCRHYGVDQTSKILCNLKFIYVSHLHLDHHQGLFDILLARHQAMVHAGLDSSPMLVLSPIQLHKALTNFTIADVAYKILPLQGLEPSGQLSLLQAADYSNLKEVSSIKEVSVTRVPHTRTSFGVSIVTSGGFKLTYSGDTQPCESLILLGKDSDLLIHEATFEDGMESDARQKHHCTTSEALEVAHKMNAKFTILTHFSQRYAKLPVFASGEDDPVGYAHDHMQVRLCDLPLLPYFNEPLKVLYNDELFDMSTKRLKRELGAAKS